MEFAEHFPVWDKLTTEQQAMLSEAAVYKKYDKGTIIHNGSLDCAGLFLILSGQLRTYIMSEEGRELTVFRMFEMDTCIFSASCMMTSIQFDVVIEAEKDTELWIIPPFIYRNLMLSSAAVANFTLDVMSSHFSEVMWLMEQILWKSFDKRLAAFLVEESNIEESTFLKITHEKIANHMGTAREVVTRMLRYFQNEEMIRLTRGAIEITDIRKLQQLQED